jgi:hypothetical protein
MVTKDSHQCSRQAVPGGMGFCWQHVPVQSKVDREKWKLRIEGAALAVSAADVLIKIIQLAVEHLHEFFAGPGAGDEQSEAKNELAAEFPPFFPDFPKSYAPGSRVDWKTLLRLFEDAQHMANNPHSENYRVLEQRFFEWFDHLNDYHKKELLAAIAEADNTQ